MKSMEISNFCIENITVRLKYLILNFQNFCIIAPLNIYTDTLTHTHTYENITCIFSFVKLVRFNLLNRWGRAPLMQQFYAPAQMRRQ